MDENRTIVERQLDKLFDAIEKRNEQVYQEASVIAKELADARDRAEMLRAELSENWVYLDNLGYDPREIDWSALKLLERVTGNVIQRRREKQAP